MRKVVYAKLQGTDAFIPGFGAFGTTLGGEGPKSKTYEVVMFESGDKLLLNLTRNGQTYRAFVPLTNVQIALYADEEPPKSDNAKQVA